MIGIWLKSIGVRCSAMKGFYAVTRGYRKPVVWLRLLIAHRSFGMPSCDGSSSVSEFWRHISEERGIGKRKPEELRLRDQSLKFTFGFGESSEFVPWNTTKIVRVERGNPIESPSTKNSRVVVLWFCEFFVWYPVFFESTTLPILILLWRGIQKWVYWGKGRSPIPRPCFQRW